MKLNFIYADSEPKKIPCDKKFWYCALSSRNSQFYVKN